MPPTHSTTTGIAIGPWIVRLLSIAFLVAVVWFSIRVWASITDDEGQAESSPSSTESPAASDDDTRIPPVVIPDEPAVLTTSGFDRLLDLMRSELGSTTVVSLNVQEDYASFEMRRPGADGTWSYYYDGFLGEPSHNETPPTTKQHVDLADIDAKTVLGLMDDLPGRFGIDNYTARYVSLQFDGFSSRGPSLSLYISGPTKTGYAVTTLDGTLVSEHPPS